MTVRENETAYEYEAVVTTHTVRRVRIKAPSARKAQALLVAGAKGRVVEVLRHTRGVTKAAARVGGVHAQHGSRSMYVGGCRCEPCVTAESTYQKAHRADRLAVGLSADDPRHGTANGYNNWRCRCAPCKAASRVYQRQARLVQLERAAEFARKAVAG